MYDPEKGYMVFKDFNETEQWRTKCFDLFMKEYSQEEGEEMILKKWQKDGERFLQENFITNKMFPYLNDCRPELLEWIQGTDMILRFKQLTRIYQELTSDNAVDFLKSLLKFFSSLGERYGSFTVTFKLDKEYYGIECNSE